jgi:rubrerythrin
MQTRAFKDLNEKEVLALAISLEEEDARIYGDFADGLREAFPASAEVFRKMREEENDHRRRLIDDFQRRFGDHIPLLRRQDIKIDWQFSICAARDKFARHYQRVRQEQPLYYAI